jgi:chitin disaccharide deacetylase
MKAVALLALASVVLSACGPDPSHAASPAVATVVPRDKPAPVRRLVLHADDFGMAHSVDRAIAQAFENHWITSASVLVPAPWFPEVAKFAHDHPDADLGIHLALNSEWTSLRWGPVAPRDRVPSLLDHHGYLPLLETDVATRALVPEVETELVAQIEMARAAGIPISHFDSHMGALHGSAPLFGAYLSLSDRYRMPIRVGVPPEVAHPPLSPREKILDRVLEIRPETPQGRWLATYEAMLAALPAGTYQLTLHLAFDDEEMRGATSDHPDWGAAWRQRDFDVVRSDEFRRFLAEQGFALVSWRDLARDVP